MPEDHRIAPLQWEIALLQEKSLALRIAGRDLDYSQAQRLTLLQGRLDKILGYGVPKPPVDRYKLAPKTPEEIEGEMALRAADGDE
jgi:hypothetical protein